MEYLEHQINNNKKELFITVENQYLIIENKKENESCIY